MALVSQGAALRRQQMNAMIQNIAKMLQEYQLMEQRQAGNMAYLTQQGEQSRELEGLRSINQMTEAKYSSGLRQEEEAQKHANTVKQNFDKMVADLTTHPKFQQLAGMILWNKQHGLPVKDLEAEAERISTGLVGAMYKLGRGNTALSPEEARGVVEAGGAVYSSALSQLAQTQRQNEQIRRVGEPQAQANLMEARAKLMDQSGISPKEQISGWRSSVNTARRFILGEGLETDVIRNPYTGKEVTKEWLMRHVPLEPAQRDNLLSELMRIESNLNRGVLPDETDNRILQNLFRTKEIGKAGKLSRETGGEIVPPAPVGGEIGQVIATPLGGETPAQKFNAPTTGTPDASGYVPGSTISFPAGAKNAKGIDISGTWRYDGNNVWTKIG